MDPSFYISSSKRRQKHVWLSILNFNKSRIHSVKQSNKNNATNKQMINSYYILPKSFRNLLPNYGFGIGALEDETRSLRSSFTTAASASGFKPKSQRAISTERVCRSSPVLRRFDIWNVKSKDSLAVFAASGSITVTNFTISEKGKLLFVISTSILSKIQYFNQNKSIKF